MRYNFVADNFHTKKLCSRFPSSEVPKSAVLRFEPPFGGLGGNVHLRLSGKRVMDFLLVLFVLFSLGVTAEALRVNIGLKSAISLQRGPVDQKFQVEGVSPPTILLLRKLG